MIDVDTIVHIAGIHLSILIVSAAIKVRVRRLILVHTTGVYSKHKAAGEGYRRIDEQVRQLCKEHRIALTILRPSMIYGNLYDKNVSVFIKMVDKYPLMPVINGARYELQPVHYEDLGQAYLDVLMNEGNTAGKEYNLPGAEPIMLRDMLTIIGAKLGKRTKFISCPFFLAYLGAWLLYILTFGKKDYREKVQRLCETRTFNYSDAKNDFGYSPRVFDAGVMNEIQQYKQSPNKR